MFSKEYKRLWVFVFFFVIAVHAILVSRHFPVSSVLECNPLCSGDLSFHFASAYEGSLFEDQDNHIYGYSPTFMAGYPWGLWNSFSKRGYEFSAAMLPFLDVQVSFYMWLILTAFLTPLIPAISCIVLRLGKRTMLICLCLSIILYQFGNIITYFWTFGNVAFPFASALCVLYLAMLWRSIQDGSNGHEHPSPRLWWTSRFHPSSLLTALLSGLLLGAIFWLHPLCILPAGVGTLVIMAISLKSLKPLNVKVDTGPLASEDRRGLWFKGIEIWVKLFVVGAVALLVVLPWVIPLLKSVDIKITGPLGLGGGIKYLVMDLLSDRAYGHPYDRRLLFHIMLVLAALGTWGRWRADDRRQTTDDRGNGKVEGNADGGDQVAEGLASGTSGFRCLHPELVSGFHPSSLIFAITAAVLLLCAHAFTYIPILKETQPYRYLVSLMIFATIPASVGIMNMVRLLKTSNYAGRILALCMFLAILPGLTSYGFDFLQRTPAEGLSDDQLKVAEWLKERNDVQGRVLCDDGTLGCMLPFFTGFDVVGGSLSDHSPLINSWTCIGQGRVFGYNREKVTLKPKTLKQYMSLYNICFVVLNDPDLKSQFNLIGDYCVSVLKVGRYEIYKVNDENLSYVWGGVDGTVVTAGPNSIVIDDPPPQVFTLKYHYMKGLTYAADLELKQRFLLEDPVPFIELDNSAGHKRITISR